MIWAEKEWFSSIWTERRVLVGFGRKNWGLTEKGGFGRFWPKKKVALVDFDWKNWFLVNFDRKNGVLLILAKKPCFDRKEWLLVDVDRQKTGCG